MRLQTGSGYKYKGNNDFDCDLWHAFNDMTKLMDLKQIVIPGEVGAKAAQIAYKQPIVKEA